MKNRVLEEWITNRHWGIKKQISQAKAKACLNLWGVKVNTIEINWSAITYYVIGLFALSGFFRGWWKEAITAFFLGILVFLLRTPGMAQAVIDWLNPILLTVWNRLPSSVHDLLATYLGLTSFQLDASSRQTWLVILLVMLGFSFLLSALLLPSQIRTAGSYITYVVTPLASFLGGLLGGLNGFLVINLVKEYLSGTNLPTGTEHSATEVAVAGGQTVGIASSGVGVQVTDLPDFTTLNNFWGWLVVAFGLLMLVLIIGSRLRGPGRPSGYDRVELKRQGDGKFELVPVAVKKT
jgi:hypothetical protein